MMSHVKAGFHSSLNYEFYESTVVVAEPSLSIRPAAEENLNLPGGLHPGPQILRSLNLTISSFVSWVYDFARYGTITHVPENKHINSQYIE